MSKIANRNAIKNLSNLHVDCQYVYQLGLQVFNDNGQNEETYTQLCADLKVVCDELEKSLQEVRKLIPYELRVHTNN